MEIKLIAMTSKGETALRDIYTQSKDWKAKKLSKTMVISEDPYTLIMYPKSLSRFPNAIKNHIKNAINAAMVDMFESHDVEQGVDYEVQ